MKELKVIRTKHQLIPYKSKMLENGKSLDLKYLTNYHKQCADPKSPKQLEP